MLAKQVRAGELPPVEKRLPDNPYVVPHNWVERGEYGGDLKIVLPSSSDAQMKEYMYGHSLLRWLNDRLDIGPGLVESWESNDDASEWTLHFRKGLKWSDGHPWTTADIMFWWEDMVLNEEHSEVPPDECKSGKGTVATLEAPDEYTLVMKFDSPAPLTADRLAMWVNRGVGPTWMEPKHYLSQFHPKYNKDVPDNWASADGQFERMRNFATNPECPTMTGWRLKSYSEGRQVIWERNPYYWCVTEDGDQLPYIDTITARVVQDPEIAKLQIQNGDVDFALGPFTGLTLQDVSGFKSTESRSGVRTLFWDLGDGSGSAFFFNYDHPDENLRKLIREPKFRQALSHAFNRDEVQKAVYFGTGEKTTGTLGPKMAEYAVNEEGKQLYREWRDSYVAYDPEKAKALLDEIGVVDRDGDGWREMPDGGKLVVRLDFPANVRGEHQQKNRYLKRDWEKIGIATIENPIPPEAWPDQWAAGRLMSAAGWVVGEAVNHLVFPGWLVPIESARWAPLEGQYYSLRGTPKEQTEKDIPPHERKPPRMEPEPGGPIEQLWDLYDRSKSEPDEMRRHQLVWQMIRIHIEHGPFFMGSVGNTPMLVVAHKDLKNVPERENLALGGVAAWIHPIPAVYDPEIFFWRNVSEHSQ